MSGESATKGVERQGFIRRHASEIAGFAGGVVLSETYMAIASVSLNSGPIVLRLLFDGLAGSAGVAFTAALDARNVGNPEMQQGE